MKKVGIITIYDEDNYGNRLQNYAVQTILQNRGFDVETIKYNIEYTMSIIKPGKRLNLFREFNKKINFAPDRLIMNQVSEIKEDLNKRYDYVVVGSDQIWNYAFKALFSDKVFASFVDKDKRIALSASIGVSELPEDPERYKICEKYMKEMYGISVREFAGKEIVEKISGRTDVKVLIDPTMMLTKEEWEKNIKKPEQINENENYILTYFLGELDKKGKQELKEFSIRHNCKIINILDYKSPYYNIGPSEFLYLEKFAKLVVTDSFHSAVFAILFGTPFMVYERKDNEHHNMYSRIDTLLEKFNLEKARYMKNFDDSILEVDNNEIEKRLDEERAKFKKYLNELMKNNK